ncbi:MAG: MlaD family protein, partial [Thermoanaerobaculia bacterium]|nr:MlaD family protein [Thermoanaerobaculia bacterium]
MADKGEKRLLRVGALVGIALAVLMAFLFFIGSERKIFARKLEYKVRLDSVTGLAEGNPVQLSGVTIGSVSEIRLPQEAEERRVDLTILVDRKYADLIRYDSRARVRKLGLIAADSYIDITPGSPEQPVLPPGSVIPAQRATDVDRIIASGEDLVDNL